MVGERKKERQRGVRERERKKSNTEVYSNISLRSGCAIRNKKKKSLRPTFVSSVNGFFVRKFVRIFEKFPKFFGTTKNVTEKYKWERKMINICSPYVRCHHELFSWSQQKTNIYELFRTVLKSTRRWDCNPVRQGLEKRKERKSRS